MRKFVVALIAMLALFTFLRDYPSAMPNANQTTQAEYQAAITQ